MKAKCKLFISAILFIGITVCFVAYSQQTYAGEANSDQTQPERQMNKPRPKPQQEPPLQPVPLLNPCSKCQLRCINFKGESYASYCHGLCVRDGFCEE